MRLIKALRDRSESNTAFGLPTCLAVYCLVSLLCIGGLYIYTTYSVI